MKLKQAAGHESATPSLAYIAAQGAGIDPEAMEGERLQQITPGSIQSTPRPLLMKRQRILAALDAKTEQMQRKREGDQGYEERLAREEAKAKAAAERS